MNSFLPLVFLHSIGFSQKALARIFENDENYEDFYNQIDYLFLQKLEFKEEKIQTVLDKKQKLDTAKIIELIEKLHIQIITTHNPLYPELLFQTPVCPYFLYVRGILPTHTNLLSIIGSRKSTSYSRTILTNIIPDLVREWYGIVSGWAYGVDSIGHKITLENNGYTLSVFGTGIDRCYPKENKELFNEILASRGALISPFPLGTLPEPYNFPIRNEIVAGISKGTLVTESAEKSGTLITAWLSLDFGRDVFAIPGDITKATSIGTNSLIRDGQAKLTISASDILSEYGPVTILTQVEILPTLPKFDDPIEASIYELLTNESLDISTIAHQLEMDAVLIAGKLSMMEVYGTVEITIDGSYKAL